MTVYSEHWAVYYTLFSIKCLLYTMYYALLTIHCVGQTGALYGSLQFTLSSVNCHTMLPFVPHLDHVSIQNSTQMVYIHFQCTLYIVLCGVQCKVYTVRGCNLKYDR